MSDATQRWRAISSFSGPEESPGFTLWRDFMRWQRLLNIELRPFGLTQPQFAILSVCGWLTRDGRDVSQQDVADYLRLDRMHVSQITKRLEEYGLIIRIVPADDLRTKHIKLTETGEELLFQALPQVEAFDKKFFNGSQ